MIMSDVGYDLNEDDIERMIGVLDVLDKPNANADTAIKFLVYMKQNFRNFDARTLDKMYAEFSNS